MLLELEKLWEKTKIANIQIDAPNKLGDDSRREDRERLDGNRRQDRIHEDAKPT